jgi:hypothetical protein
MLFCCGAAGSFLSVIGDIFLEWLFFSKMLLMRRFEDEEHQRSISTTFSPEPVISPDGNEAEK